MTVSTTFPFTTSGNYTASDSDKVEVTGGFGRLIDQRDADATFAATYTSNINGSWGGGTLTGTASNSPTASGGFLVIDTEDMVTYEGDGNLSEDNIGAIRFKVKPAYSGSPGTTQYFFQAQPTSGSEDRIDILHNSAGNVQILMWDESTVQVVADNHAWSPTAGTEYEFELNWDGATGATRFFIDGVQQGSTDTSTFTRSATTTMRFRIGRNTGGAAQDFSTNWVILFDTVQHTSNYTPNGTTPAETVYATDNPTLTTVSTVSGGLRTFTATTSASGSDAVQFVIVIGGTDYYWTGSAWATSSGYAQSNTASDINDNLLTLDTGNSAVTIKVYLHSDDGTTFPTIDEMTISYDASDTSATTPTLVFLEGWLYDHNGPISGQLIEVRPALGFADEEVFFSHDWQTFDTSASDGYFSGFIYESTSGGGQWTFRFGTKKYNVVVPDQASVNFADLAPVPVTAS